LDDEVRIPLVDIEQRLAEIERERLELLDQRAKQQARERRQQPITLRKMAEEIGCKERPLIDAAKAGRLKAWRLGGGKRGILVTTYENLQAYLDSQPAAEEERPTTNARRLEAYKAAVERARRAGRRGPLARER
jgi:hypothetical protein